MADDERRAEIEAVARALAVDSGWCYSPGYYRGLAEVAVDALDRLRDARGDDEACRCGCNELLGGHRDDCPQWGSARSPQDEDHETVGRRTVETVLGPLKVVPECRAQAVCVNGSKCWEAGRCLRSAQDEADEAGIEAAAQAMLDNQGGRPAIDQARIAVAAYLSRVSAPKADENQEAR